MDIGTGIVIGCGIFAAMGVILRNLPNKASKFLSKELGNSYKDRLDAMDKKIDEVSSSMAGKVSRIHERIDELWKEMKK